LLDTSIYASNNAEVTSFASVEHSRTMAVFMKAKALSSPRSAVEVKADWVVRTDKSRSDDNQMEILGILLQSKPLEIIQPALC
jgi:hypothetical protein